MRIIATIALSLALLAAAACSNDSPSRASIPT